MGRSNPFRGPASPRSRLTPFDWSRLEPTSPPRDPCCPWLQMSPDELEDLMSPTLDPNEWQGPSSGKQPGGFGICNSDGSRAVPASKSMIHSFNWDLPDHPQAWVLIGDELVSADAQMAPLIRLLNQAGITTVTSCQGNDCHWAYVMIADLVSALRFLRLWYRHLEPLDYPLPLLELELRDEEWRQDVGGRFPFPKSVPQDSLGFNFTAMWKLYHEDLEELMPNLLYALRNATEGQPAGRG